MNRSPSGRRLCAVANGLLSAGLLSASLPAMAQTTVNNVCMDDLAPFGLTCSANDISIANATNITILDDGCLFPGDTVDFEATFTVEVTAKEKFDIGLYFARDGDVNGDGALSGLCSISTLPISPDPPWLDLDHLVGGVQDTCGDIRKPDHSPLFPQITLTDVVCADQDGDGFLNLPNCTSWRQSGSNGLCTSPLQAFPGAPSKCNCDPGFNVPIPVPPATLEVVKTASPTSVSEPEGTVTFTVSVTNTGTDPNNDVMLNSLVDTVYGDITTPGHDGITSTTCAVPQTLVSGVPYECTFTATVAGNVGAETDVVTASGEDENGNTVTGQDDATVTITDVLPLIEVQKSAAPDQVPESGADVTFTVSVTNQSASTDPVTIDSLMDDTYGDLDGQGDCEVPQIILPGATYTCSFTRFVSGSPGTSETDTVTATGSDDEGNSVSDSDSATVDINNVPSMITLTKTAAPTAVPEGVGGLVVFTYTITNTSAVDTVTIDTLTDSVYGNVAALPPPPGGVSCTMPQTLLPGASFTCQIQAQVQGDAADVNGVTNTATAAGFDDDGNPLSDTDDATVNFTNVPPSATLTKTAKSAIVTYEVVVSNTSSAEELFLTSLVDDSFGNVTQTGAVISRTTCSVPQTLAIGATYTCEFDALVTSSPHTDEVTGQVNDNDGSATLQVSDTATVTFN
ncbi:DUF7507 domain-containing protein [Sorangium sp. So ce363]|uniref:DUF7507 domain-containing protein n=1 Tax=Sorangium sp. So ce363 TaxID=3133304 RepID=UPI003F60F01D